MNKITFEDLPSKRTPINAENLNLMQDNIESVVNENADAINTINTKVNENAEEIETFKNRGTIIPCITARISEDVTLTSSTDPVKQNLDTIVVNNSDFKLSNDGGIICPFDGTVLVTASAMLSPRKGYCGLQIWKNGAYKFDHYEPAGTPTYGTAEMSNKPLKVKKGDVIHLYIGSSAVDDKIIANQRHRLELMYIDFEN